jgi:hypothetical protein
MSTYTYAEALRAAEKVNWTVEDLIGGDKRLDFSRPFLPESLARTAALEFLTPAEQTALNQIRGHEYLRTFELAEEFILPFVLDHARPRIGQDDHETRAFLTFAGEEAKHIHLFRRFRAAFEQGFGSPCGYIGPAEEITKAVLAHDPLSVALVILHIEWMTQRHFQDSVRDDRGLDPLFTSLLRHHWMEEAQHAKLDTMMVEALAATRTPEEIARAIEGYLDIGGLLDQGLMAQVDLNREALEAATRRRMTPVERERYLEVQRQAVRWTYLGSGMTHARFVETLKALGPASEKVLAVAPAFC